MADPTATLLLVEIDANEGLRVSAKNLSLTVVENGRMPISGLLLSPQQSRDVVVPGSDLNPVGQAVHTDAEPFENVSAAHVEHDVAASAD